MVCCRPWVSKNAHLLSSAGSCFLVYVNEAAGESALPPCLALSDFSVWLSRGACGTQGVIQQAQLWPVPASLRARRCSLPPGYLFPSTQTGLECKAERQGLEGWGVAKSPGMLGQGFPLLLDLKGWLEPGWNAELGVPTCHLQVS